MKKRVATRPGKAEGIFGILFGLVFVCIGLFVIVPALGPFGIAWTVLAVVITFYNVYLAFGKKYPDPELPAEEPEAGEVFQTVPEELENPEEL